MNLLTKAIVAAGIVLAIGVGSTGAYLLTAGDSDGDEPATASRTDDARDSGGNGAGLAMCAPDVPDCNDTIVLPDDITECVAREDGIDCEFPEERKDVPDCVVILPEGAAPEIDPAPDGMDLPDGIAADLDARRGVSGGSTDECADLPPDCAVSSDGETVCPERRPLFDDGGGSGGTQGSSDAVDPVEPLE